MTDSPVTRDGLQNPQPDKRATIGGQGPRHRRRGGRGEQPMVPGAEFTSYYGRSVINPPVWKWPIPAYFFTGGLAAGSSLLAFGADLSGNPSLRRTSRVTALAALGVSTAFLIEDLGKPSRFHHMLRVAKLTSPMSVGTWILSGYAPGAGGAALSELTGRVPRLGSLAGAWAATLAPLLGTYTAVLVADTAVPVWHAERHTLPFSFAGSAMAASGGMALILNPPAAAAPARRLAVIGAVVETIATKVGERGTGEVGDVYHEGRAGKLRKASDACTVAGAGVAGLLGRWRATAAVGGALLVAGSVLERFTVFHGGMQSAEDPRYTVDPQRSRIKERGPASANPRISTANDTLRARESTGG